MDNIKPLNLVALLNDLPDYHLQRGEVGTVLDVFTKNEHHPGGYLVEFFDEQQNLWQEVEITDQAQIMLLHLRRQAA